MKKVVGTLVALLLVVFVGGCAVPENLGSTIEDQTSKFTDSVSDQFDEIGNQIDEKIDETVSGAVDSAKAEASDAMDEAKDDAMESLGNTLSDITEDIAGDIGIQIDNIVEFHPGLYFEEPMAVTYDQDGIRMNAFWEVALDPEDSSTYKASMISLDETGTITKVEDGAVVTFSFFDNLPGEVKVFHMVDGVGEEVELSLMENKLSGKATYSFVLVFEEDTKRAYIMEASFEGMDDFIRHIDLERK